MGDIAAGIEDVPPSEAGAIAAITRLAQERVRTAAAESPPALRDAHAKPHGIVQAIFRVLDDVPEPLRVGVFRQPCEFQAWVRFSNGNAKPGKDSTQDGRGMAIKLLGVEGSPSTTQDFLQINSPAFFVRDAADYVDFTTLPFWRFILPGVNPLNWRLREALIAVRIANQTVSNPLNLRYYTMTPFLCGTVPVKASSRPQPPPSTFTSRDGSDFMRANLAAHLAVSSAQFEFLLQPQTDPRTQPVEDPRVTWDEALAPFVPVAHVTIPAQRFATPERDSFGEDLSFTPWHCLPEHRPLGGINRVRRTVYDAISELRHDLNHTLRQEPPQRQIKT